MSKMNERSNAAGTKLSGALAEFAEYTVPDELGDALKARKSTQVPSSITVKRKRESLSGVGRHEEDSAKKPKKTTSAAKKARNKLKKQKKKARDRAKKAQ